MLLRVTKQKLSVQGHLEREEREERAREGAGGRGEREDVPVINFVACTTLKGTDAGAGPLKH